MKNELEDSGSRQSSEVNNCWEFKNCKRTLCPVYLNNNGALCYYISGTLGGGTPQPVTTKIEDCKKCDFYQYNEKRSLEFRGMVLERLKKLEDELRYLFKISPEEKAAIFKQRAEYLSSRINYKEPEEKVRILTFSLGNEKYCIRIQHALEIINVTDVNELPCTPHHFAGIVNLRGNILTLIDLNELLGIEKDSEKTFETIIVIEVDGETTGIIVDGVEDILDIGVDQIAPPLTTLGGVKDEFIEGEILIEERPLTLLNLEKMMRDESMKVFEMVNPNL